MSAIAWLQLTTFIINLIVLLYIYVRFFASPMGKSWVAMYSTLVVWALADFLSTTAPSPYISLFWVHVTEASAVLVGALMLRFILVILYPHAFASPKKTLLYMIIPSLFALFALTTNAFTYQATKISWGYVMDHTVAYYYLTGIIVLFALASILLPIIEYRKLSFVLKKQMRLYIIAFLFPVIGGAITEILAPAYGIVVPPMTTVLFSITGLTMAYAFGNYQFLTISPGLVLDNIFDTIGEAVIVTDTSQSITLTNKAAERLFEHDRQSLLGTHFETLIEHASLYGNSQYSKAALRTKTNKTVPVIIHGTPLVVNAHTEGTIYVLRDISEIDKLVEELTLSKERLENKLSEIQMLNTLLTEGQQKMSDQKNYIRKLEYELSQIKNNTKN